MESQGFDKVLIFWWKKNQNQNKMLTFKCYPYYMHLTFDLHAWYFFPKDWFCKMIAKYVSTFMAAVKYRIHTWLTVYLLFDVGLDYHLLYVIVHKVCFIKIRSKLTSVLLLYLLRFFMKQTLHWICFLKIVHSRAIWIKVRKPRKRPTQH